MKKAIQYRRVSTKEQDDKGYSPEVQAADNEAYAARNGLVIVADFFDDASGMLFERSGLTAARRYMAENDIKAIISHNNDRISRHPLHYTMLRDEWEANGIELHYAMRGKISFDFGGQVSEDIYGRFAKEWWKRITENTVAGKRAKISSGKVINTSRAAYGYRQENDALVIVEEEAVIVRLIFTMYVEGHSMQAIADYLTQNRVPSHSDLHPAAGPRKQNPYGFWHARTIQQLLTNETYRGVWYYGKTKHQKWIDENGKRHYKTIFIDRSEWIAVEVPAIIDNETWERAQYRMTTNKERAARNTKHNYLLAKRMKCGFCGKSIYAVKRHKETFYYYCASHQEVKFPTHHKCNLKYHRADNIEAHAWFWIKVILQDPDYIFQIIEAAQQSESAQQAGLATELQKAEAAIAKKENELKRLLRAFAAEEGAEDIAEIRGEIKREISQLRAKIDRINTDLDKEKSSRDITLELSEVYYRFQDGLFRYSNEPFQIKKNWVEALDLTMILGYQGDNDLAQVNCRLSPELYSLLSIDSNTSRSKLCNLTWTIRLSEKRPSELSA